MCFELPFINECITVVYMSCGVIAHMIGYEDLSRALSEASCKGMGITDQHI